MTEEALSTRTPGPALPGTVERRSASSGAMFALLGILATVIAGLVLAALLRGEPVRQAQRASVVSTTTTIDPGLKGSFAVLQAPQSGEAIRIAAAVPAFAGPNPVGANPALARAATGPNGELMSVVPARGGICLVSTADAGCVPTAAAKAGYAVGIGATPKGSVVAGLAPDGVRRVSVQLTGGETRSANVTDNVYSVQTGDGGTQSISLQRSGKTMTIPFVTPAVRSFGVEQNGAPLQVR
jgi:hypothetical protein